MTYLLLVLQMGLPGPLFSFQMPDERTCYMNMVAISKVLNNSTNAGCFDMEKQILHIMPKPQGEKID